MVFESRKGPRDRQGIRQRDGLLNLLYRERADLADNQEDYDRDIKTADRYLDDSMNMKKIKAARQPQGAGGIVTGSGK